MKKNLIKLVATLFLCATLALGFTACGDKENNSSGSSGVNTEQGSGDDSSEQTHTHSYTAVTTAPTCTERGFTTYACDCGDEYIADYVNALNHDFTSYISDNNAT